MRRRGSRKTVTATFAILLAALVGAGYAISIASDSRATAHEVAEALDAANTQQQVLEKRLDDVLASQDGHNVRLGALESTLAEEPDVANTTKKAARSVYTVRTAGGGSGSAFVVRREQGRSSLVSNFHVIADDYVNGRRRVDVIRGNTTYEGQVIEVSESDDLALISVDQGLPPLPIAKQRPAVGEPLLVLGSPLGLGGTVTSGIVSAFRTQEGLAYLQFSAPISPGNSGGPVIDERGRVVGVAVAKMIGGGAEGIGFAIPRSRLCSALDVC